MKSATEKYKERKVRSVSQDSTSMKNGQSASGFADNRPASIVQRRLQEMGDQRSGSSSQGNITQAKTNQTGLPDSLKSGVESLSGMSMNDVRVHHNSNKPAQLQAHAYAKGTDIHVGPGQEKHLPHEAWHIVQQKQGKVAPTLQLKGNVKINDDVGLEREADVMGAKAAAATTGATRLREVSPTGESIQREVNDKSSATSTADDQKQEETATQISEAVAAPEDMVRTRPFSACYDGSLQSLSDGLKEDPAGATTLQDNQLMDILKRTFNSNWFKMKACLTADLWPGIDTKPDHSAGIGLMTAMVNMRGRVWDAFVKETRPGIVAHVESFMQRHAEVAGAVNNNSENLNDNFKLKDAAGSDSVTSDIDLSADGQNTEIGLAMLNRAFNAKHGVEPGAMFDINVYASDWMFDIQVSDPSKVDGMLKQDISSKSEAVVSTGKELSAKKQKEKDEKLEVWSMVKIRRNMTPAEWTGYKTEMLTSIGSETAAEDKRMKMTMQFGEVDKEHLEWESTVIAETARLETSLTEEQRQAEASNPFAHEGKDEYAHEARQMEASNKQYERIMENVKVMRLRVQLLKNSTKTEDRETVEQLLVDIASNVAKGLTYANEVYATEGAVRHTVVGIQIANKKKAALDDKAKTDASITGTRVDAVLDNKELYVQAVNENVGDTLHSLNHNEHDPQYAVYRAGKYIDRLCQAIVSLTGQDFAVGISDYADLKEIGDKSVLEKGGLAGRDPDAVHHAPSFFSQYNSSTLGSVKQKAITVGARAVAKHKSKEEI